MLGPGECSLVEGLLISLRPTKWATDGDVLIAEVEDEPEPDAQREPLATVPEPSPFVRGLGTIAALIALPFFCIGLLIGGAIRLARRM